MDYKIRVENEAESKEVQELFELLGFEKQVWGFFPRGKYFIFANANYYSRDSVINFSECDYRELTIQELLDLVVLNRNLIDDATHACDYPSGLGVKLSGVWYGYNYNEKKWELWVDDSEYKVRDLKPIDKNEQVLKEILEGILPEFEFEAIDAFIESNVEQRQKHSHYKKDVSHLNMIDIYRVTEMFKPHSCGAHIAKKALCSGQRGHKDLLTDIQDIIDTAERWKEMLIEDENSCKD